MRWGWHAGWRDGYASGMAAGTVRLHLATARISMLEAQVDAQIARADRLTDRLLAVTGVRGVAAVSAAVEDAQARKDQLFLHRVAADPTDEVPFEDPDGLYRNAAQALLDPGAQEPPP